MLTVDELCTQMIGSGQTLTRRNARAWWTKGFLPVPQRKWLGRGRGTETFWSNPQVLKQAQAADDFLRQHRRAYTAILGLWLSGFPIDLGRVRTSYEQLLSRRDKSIRGRRGQPLDDAVGELAGRISANLTQSDAPVEARNKVSDLVLEFMEVFYDLPETDLAELWQETQPHLTARTLRFSGFADVDLKGDDIVGWVHYFRSLISLRAQRQAIASAKDYEITRARRVVHLTQDLLRHLERAGPRDDCLGQDLLIVVLLSNFGFSRTLRAADWIFWGWMIT